MAETQMPNFPGANKHKPNIFRRIKAKTGDYFSTVLLFGMAFLAALFLNAFIFQPYEVEGSSMEPTLSNRNRLIVLKSGRTWAKITSADFLPKRGEIIVFQRKSSNKTQLIKRVIGLPGERVLVANGVITVFNAEFPDGFNPDLDFDVSLATTSGQVDVLVGDREVFVAGDNRIPGASLDSRSSLGNVPLENIVGSLILRIYPFSDFSGF